MSASTPTRRPIESDNHICKGCGRKGSEIKVLSCGCTFHAKCFPVKNITETTPNPNDAVVTQSSQQSSSKHQITCPNCGQTCTQGIYIFPLYFRDIEECTKEGVSISGREQNYVHNNPQKINCFDAVIEPILLASCFTESVDTEGDDEVYFRNGRWTSPEVDYIKYLREQFDSGSLPLPPGIKLSDFLRRLLLCKSSRLRKKLKLSNFCKRKYLLGKGTNLVLDCNVLSNLEELFLGSLETEPSRRVLRFNFSRMWGKYFWSLCQHLNLNILVADEWLSSLEDIERRASIVKEEMTKQKQNDFHSQDFLFERNGTVSFSAGMEHDILHPNAHNWNVDVSALPSRVDSMNHLPISSARSTIITSIKTAVGSEDDDSYYSNNNAVVEPLKASPRLMSQKYSPKMIIPKDELDLSEILLEDFPIDTNDDLEALLLSEAEESSGIEKKRIKVNRESASDVVEMCEKISDWSPFVDKVSHFLEEENLPFTYFDVWVARDESKTSEVENNEENPSSPVTSHQQATNKLDGTRLWHVGHGLKGNVESIWTVYHMTQFGSYSTTFSFPPGIGLPGRVYNNGVPVWDNHVQTSKWKDFPRVSGAQKHGVENALGIPVTCKNGRLVLALYTSEDVKDSINIVQKCWNEFNKYVPQSDMKLFSQPPQEISTQDSLSRKVAAKSYNDPEGEAMLNLISRYMPSSDFSSLKSDSLNDKFMSLRLFLLRRPSMRSVNEGQIFEVLKRSYRSYVNVKKDSKDIASLLVSDHHMISSSFIASSDGKLSPWPQANELRVDCQDHNQENFYSSASKEDDMNDDSPVVYATFALRKPRF